MIVTLTDISKSFGDQKVISGMNCSFESGRYYRIEGDSGSGKTTLLHMIAGLIKPDSGTIDPADRITSMVFQEDRLIEHLTAEENLRAVGITGDIRSELAQILPPDELTKKVSEFSGGMKRRVAVARACLKDSDLLILDEPFTGLDVNNIKNMLEYIMAHKRDRILIITSHAQIPDFYHGDPGGEAQVICL
ncbi:MAG: ABC transporter ATP-binding protein [Clostridiales bacterium]|nr:ABC transporter ATP-binding protein [Clostridiales bacterium]